MLRSETLFGKRDANTPNQPANNPVNTNTMSSASSPLNSAPKSILPASVASPAPVTATPSASTNEGGSKLIVGPNIKLKGVEITDCDTLVVEEIGRAHV